MCQLAGISRASYYRCSEESAPRRMDTLLRDQIQQIAVMKNRRYGYRRIQVELWRKGWLINHKRVLRLMREDNLLCVRKKAFVPMTTDSRHEWKVWPNLARGMQTTAINQLWVSDITYIRLLEEFVYLAVILDAHSRRVIGWALETYLTASVAVQALKMALQTRNPEPGLIHHSDRGVQYACSDYTAILLERGIQISMSRIGNPYDNAKAESFMKTLKCEQLYGESFRDLKQLRRCLHRFIEEIYNRERLHSALSYCSPEEFEQNGGKPERLGLNALMLGKGARGPLPQTPSPARTVGGI